MNALAFFISCWEWISALAFFISGKYFTLFSLLIDLVRSFSSDKKMYWRRSQSWLPVPPILFWNKTCPGARCSERGACSEKMAENKLSRLWQHLRWLKTVSSTFQDVDFDVSLLPVFITWCYNHGIRKLPSHWWTRWYHFRDTIGYYSNTMTCSKRP